MQGNYYYKLNKLSCYHKFYILSCMVYILDQKLSNIQRGIDLHNYY